MTQPNYHNTSPELDRIILSAANNREIRAGILTTRDRDHAIHIICGTALGRKKELYHFSVASRRKWNQAQFRFETCGSGSHDPAELLAGTGNLKGGAVVVFEDLLATLRDSNGDRNARQQLASLISSEQANDGTVLIFLEPPEAEEYIPSMLAGGFFRICIPMPGRQEIKELALREVITVMTELGRIEQDKADAWCSRFAPELTGLTRTAATQALRDALALERTAFDQAEKYLAIRKRQHLSQELSMEIMDDLNGELPVGLDYLYGHLERHRERITHFGKDRSRGILLIGPPGTGKTMLAKAAGNILRLPVIEFRIGALMNSYLGATERRFDQAFQTLQAMAPNVVFIDEIEKAFSQGGGENDGGTMMRITGRLLTWLSENPNPNFIIATSNNVARMGELGLTMTRSGRFDKMFFLDVPSRSARKQMLTLWLEGIVPEPEQTAAEVADATRFFSGADLRAMFNEAHLEAGYKQTNLSAELLLTEVRKRATRVQALYESFAPLRRFAELHCEPAGPIGAD